MGDTQMGILGGLYDAAKSGVKFATAPARGLVKIAATQVETGAKVGYDLLTLQPGKAIDDLGKGLHKQVDNVVGIPKDQWAGVKGAASGLAEAQISGAKFVGEPVRGVARVAANQVSTAGNVAGNLLEGDVQGAASDLKNGGKKQNEILKETIKNQVNNAF
jgi:hypothetical protein